MPISLPRSVTAALWIHEVRRAVTAGSHDVRHRAVHRTMAAAQIAVQGEDEPHVGLEQVWEVMATGPTPMMVHAALPVPGAVGVPAEVADAAVTAEEAVIAVGSPGMDTFVAVPQVTAFGTDPEPGAMVTWHLHRCTGPVPVPDSPAEARRSLAEALEVAIDALTRMDVARWRAEAAHDIAMLASPDVPPEIDRCLPAVDSRRRDLLVRAARLSTIVELASVDDGAAVTMWQADQRTAAMRHIETAARRAMVSATVSGGPAIPV